MSGIQPLYIKPGGIVIKKSELSGSDLTDVNNDVGAAAIAGGAGAFPTSLIVTHTPVNYSIGGAIPPVSKYVDTHLAGIDTELGTILGLIGGGPGSDWVSGSATVVASATTNIDWSVYNGYTLTLPVGPIHGIGPIFTLTFTNPTQPSLMVLEFVQMPHGFSFPSTDLSGSTFPSNFIISGAGKLPASLGGTQTATMSIWWDGTNYNVLSINTPAFPYGVPVYQTYGNGAGLVSDPGAPYELFTSTGWTSLALSALIADVAIAGPATGNLLRFNGTYWANAMLVAGDIPNIDASKITTGTMATARLGSGTAAANSYLAGDQTYKSALVPASVAATGTVTGSNLSGTNSGDVTLTAIGSAPSANGATLSGQALTMQPADGTHGGVLTSGAQTIGGAKTFTSSIVMSLNKPILDFTDTFGGGVHWQFRAGGSGTTSFDLYNFSATKSIIQFQNDGNINIGANGNPGNNSRLYVFGGANGANIDVRGDAAVSDQSVIELEGSDYDTNVQSVRLQYYGAANIFGTTLGYSNVDLGVLAWQGANVQKAIIATFSNSPIHFGTNASEWMILSALGDLGIHTTTPTANFQVNQATFGPGTVSNGASGTTVTGVGTQFTNTFKIGDTITIGSETKAISAIGSDTSMTTASFTSAHTNLAYTLVGGTRFQVFGNGAVTAAGTWTAGNFSGTHSGTSSGTNTGDQTITLTGNVTGSGTSSFATTISAGVVTLAMHANLAANSIMGNNTGSPAAPIALTVAQTLTLLGVTSGASVSSVAMTVPSIMSVAGSPITTSGTLAVTLATQNQNLLFAGPASGAAAIPTFRAIVPLDIGTGSATANNVLLGNQTWGTVPNSGLTNSSLTIGTTAISLGATASTLTAIGFDQETYSLAATVSAAGSTQGTATALTKDYNVITTAAASTGVVLPTATLGRKIVVVNKGANPLAVYPASGGAIDALSTNAAITIPVAGWIELDASSTTQWYSTLNAISTSALTGDVTASGTNNSMGTTIAAGVVTLAKMANLAANSIIGNNTGSPATPIALTAAQVLTLINVASGASVSSVAMTVPSILSVSGTPITGAGTLAVTLATQSQNLIFSGPSSGAAAIPTFRALVALDMGTGTANTTVFHRGDLTWTNQLAGDFFISNATSTILIGGTSKQTLNSLTPTLQVLGITNAAATSLNGQYSANATGPTYQFLKSRGATIGTIAATVSGDVNGKLDFWAANANATSAMANAAYMQVVVDGTPGTTFSPGRFEFYTATAAAAPALRATITNGGVFITGATSTAQTVNSLTAGFQSLAIAQSSGTELDALYSADALGNVVQYLKSRGATVGTLTGLNSADVVLDTQYLGVNSSSAVAVGANYKVIIDTAPGATFVGMRHEWWTGTNAAASSIGMKLDNAKLLTVQAGVTLTTGDMTATTGNVVVTAGNITMQAAAALIQLNGATAQMQIQGTGSSLDFGSNTRQMIQLWGGANSYGIGIQGSTQYFRTNGNFAWYNVGVHSNTALDPGAGGTTLATLISGLGLNIISGVYVQSYRASGNVAGGYASLQGTHIGWNMSGGNGETDIVCNRGGGGGGFNFYITDGSTFLTAKNTFNANGEVLGTNYGTSLTQHNTVTSAVTFNFQTGSGFHAATATSATACTITLTAPTLPCTVLALLTSPASGTVPALTMSPVPKGTAMAWPATLGKSSLFTLFYDGTTWWNIGPASVVNV